MDRPMPLLIPLVLDVQHCRECDRTIEVGATYVYWPLGGKDGRLNGFPEEANLDLCVRCRLQRIPEDQAAMRKKLSLAMKMRRSLDLPEESIFHHISTPERSSESTEFGFGLEYFGIRVMSDPKSKHAPIISLTPEDGRPFVFWIRLQRVWHETMPQRLEVRWNPSGWGPIELHGWHGVEDAGTFERFLEGIDLIRKMPRQIGRSHQPTRTLADYSRAKSELIKREGRTPLQRELAKYLGTSTDRVVSNLKHYGLTWTQFLGLDSSPD